MNTTTELAGIFDFAATPHTLAEICEHTRQKAVEYGQRAYVYLAGPAINTEYVHPPIPDRNSDWSATFDGDEGKPGHSAFGRTGAEAIRKLVEGDDRAVFYFRFRFPDPKCGVLVATYDRNGNRI
jgi:hypothetical protein